MNCRNTLLCFASVLLALAVIAPLHAAPPAELTGRFVELGDDRLEFDDEFAGADGEEPIDYTYEVLDGLTAELVVQYLSSSRRRDITLNFLSDGTPNGYQEFDFLSTEMPFPPAFRSGSFAIGELDSLPPTESSAPDSLVGLFLNVSGKRLEFLTSDRGRCFLPGMSDYFFYEYGVEDDSSALVEIFYDDGIRELALSLVFDESGAPTSFTSTERIDGIEAGETAGAFSTGTNLHLADLKIGFGGSDLIGDDLFNQARRRQTVSTRTSSSATLVFPFAIENDGDNDAFRLHGTRGRGKFRVGYFSVPTRENLTAAMTTGRYETGPLEHLGDHHFTMEIKPLQQRGSYRGRVKARSLSIDAAGDSVHAHVKMMPAKKGPALGKLPGNGRSKASPAKGGTKPSGKK